MRKLDKGVAARVFDELDEIAKLEDPRSRGKALTGNRLWRLHPRSINRRKAYGAIPGKSLARINVRGTFSL